MIEIKSTAELGKSLAVKREKQEDSEVVACHLKFADLFVSREELDELCRQPIGWHAALYDDQGAPVARLVLGLPKGEWSVTGTLTQGEKRPGKLNLLEATLDGVSLELIPLGALLAGSLAWKARGDEVEDVTELLGKLVAVQWRLTDGGQQDLVQAAARQAVDGFRRLAAQDGIESIEIRDGDGKTVAKFRGKGAREARA
jgi:hypothetical protein